MALHRTRRNGLDRCFRNRNAGLGNTGMVHQILSALELDPGLLPPVADPVADGGAVERSASPALQAAKRPSVWAISSPKLCLQASPMPAIWRSSWARRRSSWAYPTILFLALSAMLSPICGCGSTHFTLVARACNGSATVGAGREPGLRLPQRPGRHRLAPTTFSFFLSDGRTRRPRRRRARSLRGTHNRARPR